MESTGRQVGNLVSQNSDILYSLSISGNLPILINFSDLVTLVAPTLL